MAENTETTTPHPTTSPDLAGEMERSRLLRERAARSILTASQLCATAARAKRRSQWIIRITRSTDREQRGLERLALSIERLVDILDESEDLAQAARERPELLDDTTDALGAAADLLIACESRARPDAALMNAALDRHEQLVALVEKHARAALPRA